MKTSTQLFFITLIAISFSQKNQAMQENQMQRRIGEIQTQLKKQIITSNQHRKTIQQIQRESHKISDAAKEMFRLQQEINNLNQLSINEQNKKKALEHLVKILKICVTIVVYYGTEFVIALLEALDFFTMGWVIRLLIKIPTSLILSVAINAILKNGFTISKNIYEKTITAIKAKIKSNHEKELPIDAFGMFYESDYEKESEICTEFIQEEEKNIKQKEQNPIPTLPSKGLNFWRALGIAKAMAERF